MDLLDGCSLFSPLFTGTDDHQYYPDCACGIDEYEFNSTKAKLNVYKLGCSRFEKRGYHLRVLYEPMGYFDLFNAAAFPSYVYFAFFVGIAVLAVLFLFAVRLLNVCATCCRPSLLVVHKKKNIRLTLKSFILRSQMPVGKWCWCWLVLVGVGCSHHFDSTIPFAGTITLNTDPDELI